MSLPRTWYNICATNVLHVYGKDWTTCAMLLFFPHLMPTANVSVLYMWVIPSMRSVLICDSFFFFDLLENLPLSSLKTVYRPEAKHSWSQTKLLGTQDSSKMDGFWMSLISKLGSLSVVMIHQSSWWSSLRIAAVPDQLSPWWACQSASYVRGQAFNKLHRCIFFTALWISSVLQLEHHG